MRFWQVLSKAMPGAVLPLATMGVLRSHRHISAVLSLLGQRDNIVVVLDNDSAGTNAKELLTQRGIRWVCPLKYPDEMTDNEILSYTKGIL